MRVGSPIRNFIKYDDGDEKWYDLSKSRDGSGHVFVDAAEKNTWVLVGRKKPVHILWTKWRRNEI